MYKFRKLIKTLSTNIRYIPYKYHKSNFENKRYMAKQTYWLVYANEDKCDHTECLLQEGFISWVNRYNFQIGDIVYVYVSDKKYVRFKTVVTEVGVPRKDAAYWKETAPKDKTCTFEYVAEYYGDKLYRSDLEYYGLKSMETPIRKNVELQEYITKQFDSMGYAYIIDKVCPVTKQTNKLVRLILPILVNWAKAGITDKTYGDLNKLIGYKDGKNTSIGHQLGSLNLILEKLSKATGIEIPTPNSLVCNVQTGLPSEGFYFVKDSYKGMSLEQKRKFVRQLNSEAINYKNWDWVLAQLGLKPVVSSEDEEVIRSGKMLGYGVEGAAHKLLKEYVANHPEVVGAKENGTNEHILLSADRLDVWFPQSHIAVEVKPKSSPNADIMRGLYQCVKYKAILDAEAAVHGEIPNARVILVIEGSLSVSNQEIMKTLGIEVISEFEIQ